MKSHYAECYLVNKKQPMKLNFVSITHSQSLLSFPPSIILRKQEREDKRHQA